MSTLHSMLKRHTQHGTTLTGVMIGLVAAVAIIALLMWYMNTHKTTFQPYTPPESPPKETEILRPQDKTTALPVPEKPASTVENTAHDDLGQLIGRLDQAEAEKQPEESVAPVIVRKTPPAHKTTPTPQDILNGAANKPTPNPVNSGNTVLQIGSFATRTQAESQQAKLMMLDVKTHIETAEIGGQTVYRVRSRMSATQAQAAQQRLSENHIDSIVLPNP